MTVSLLTLTALLLSQQPSDEMARRQETAIASLRANVERLRDQRAGLAKALEAIQQLEVEHFGGAGGEGLHAHEILVLADRALGTKHRCYVPRELLERQR